MKTDFTAKTTLAKLLAKEDITVIESNMHTAYFDVKNRVLGLPSWKDRGKDVYDMLIGHEVGHALYTPVDALERFHAKCGSTPFDVCNIVEDIRIERIIQNTYPGLPRIFKTAYTILTDEDFFSIKDKDISSLNFLDRLNLRGKIGTIKSIPLSLDEELIYKKCLNAESFDDVLDICLEIKELIENEENSKDDSNDSDESDESEESEPEECEGEKSCTDSADDGESDEESDDDSESHSNDSDSDESDDSDCDASSDNESDDSAELDESDDSANDGREPETPQNMLSETIKSFESTLSKEVETPLSRGYTPLIAPRRSYIYDTIIDYKKLATDRRECSGVEGAYTLSNSHRVEKFSEFKKITNKKVGTLVREFEQRKAAFQYSRATQSRTGKLDVNKLHSYKLIDELFLSQTKLADAKSHGMIFLLDYSGSMSNVVGDVIMQTLNLITFCKKVNIPFRVYSFTSTWFYTEDSSRPSAAPHEVDLSNVSLVEQISSDLSKSNYDEAFKSLWVSATYCVRYSKYDQLGGTPLNAVLTMMPTVINDFIAKHSVQKLNFVTLTDGDSERLRSNTNFNGEEATSAGKYRVNLAGKTHQISPRDTSTLMSIIHNMPCVTTLGFYLPSCKRGVRNAINRMTKWDQKKSSKYTKIHKKDGFVVVEATGYDTYYVLDHTVKIDDTEFEFQNDGVDIASTKKAQTKLAKEFSKHHGAARKTRVLLTNIATQIA